MLHKERKYFFHQGIGRQTINFAEITAIKTAFKIIERLNISDIERIIVLTDSEIVMTSIWKGNLCLNEYTHTRDWIYNKLITYKAITIKIPSHLPIPIIENDIADRLANIGRHLSAEFPQIVYHDDFSFSHLSYEDLEYHRKIVWDRTGPDISSESL